MAKYNPAGDGSGCLSSSSSRVCLIDEDECEGDEDDFDIDDDRFLKVGRSALSRAYFTLSRVQTPGNSKDEGTSLRSRLASSRRFKVGLGYGGKFKS